MTDLEQFHLISIAKKALFNSPTEESIDTLRADDSWVREMKNMFGKDYVLSELQLEWITLVRMLQEDFSRAHDAPPPRKRRRKCREMSAMGAVQQFVSDLPAQHSSVSEDSENEEESDRRGKEVILTVDGAVRELLSVFRREARADRRLVRKLMQLLSRVCDTSVDPCEPGSDSEPGSS